MRHQLQQEEQRLRQRSASAKHETDAMLRQLRERREHVQEQRVQMTVAQQQMRENMQGKTDYEQHVRHEMQTAIGKYELMEQRAELHAASDQEHHRYLRAVAGAQQRQEHVRRREQLASTEAA